MCSIDSDDDYPDVWCETPRKARKAHVCSSCGGPIRPGDVYLSHFCVFEGYTFTGKLCSACEADRRAFADAHEGYLPVPDAFPQALADCIADGDEESEARWKPMLAALRARAEATPAAVGEETNHENP